MDSSARLSLPFLSPQQAQKHVTVNESLRLLDALVQTSVASFGATAPPASPVDGEVHIPGSGAIGAWAGWDFNLACFIDGAWRKIVPQRGFLVWVEDQSRHLTFLDAPDYWGPPGVVEQLSAPRTYYVRTDGNDANSGLANSAGGAFLTIQRAVDAAAALAGAHAVTVQVAAGTYNVGVITLKPHNLASIAIVGDTGAPANVVVNASNIGFYYPAGGSGSYSVRGFRIVATNYCLRAGKGSTVQFGEIEFGAAGDHIFAEGGFVEKVAGYAIIGNATRHVLASTGGTVAIHGITITIASARAFTTFVSASRASIVSANSIVFAGAGVAGTTGARYSATLNSVIDTSGGGANYFPGNSAGAVASGGQYA